MPAPVDRCRCGPSTISAVIASGVHLFPFRTEKLSPTAPMVLGAQAPGRVGRRRITSGGPRERPSFHFPLELVFHGDSPAGPPLEDELVHLRPWIDADVPAIVAACNDPEIVRWTTVPTPYSPEDARAWLARCGDGMDGGSGAAGGDRAVVGRARRGDHPLAARQRSVSSATGPRRRFRGRGYVPRAVQRCFVPGASTSSTCRECSSGRSPATSLPSVWRRRAASRAKASFAPGSSSAASAGT